MYAAIVVGARCAGASVALLLARQGKKVLMIDREHFPSDKVNSTHLIWHAGAACLQRWGLLEKLKATNCPPLNKFMLNLGEMELHGQAGGPNVETSSGYSPRRIVLDNLLVEEAKAAGVEFLQGCSVKELIQNNGRITGVRYKTQDGDIVDANANIVIGADGLNSTIAKLVGAEDYNTKPRSAQTYFAYFSGFTLEKVEFHARPGRMAFAWNTNDNQIMAGFSARIDDTASINADIENCFWTEMENCAPDLVKKLKASKQESEIINGGTPSFMRKAGGPGWALIGDAGINMDPITAAGITNAFIQAEMLAETLAGELDDDELSAAMEQFCSDRDQRLGPHFEFTGQMAALEPETPDEVVQIFMALHGNQADTDAYFGIFAQTMPVAEFFEPENIQRILEHSKPT